MRKSRRLLVALSDLHHRSNKELLRAAALARASGARVELFHALTFPLTASHVTAGRVTTVQLTPEKAVEAAQKALSRIAASKPLQGCKVSITAAVDQPVHEAIIRRAIAIRSDLIIVGTHPRNMADRLTLRHTDWELLRHSPLPVLLVKSRRMPRRQVILAAIDPMHANAKPARLDQQIMDVAESTAGLLKGTLHAMHAYMPMSVMLAASTRMPFAWNVATLDSEYTLRVSREFNRAVRAARLPAARRHLRVGPTPTELVTCARRIHASVVVMGAVSRTRLERLFIGSTAERVIDDLGCDVLIVPPRPRKAR